MGAQERGSFRLFYHIEKRLQGKLPAGNETNCDIIPLTYETPFRIVNRKKGRSCQIQ
jgi:hypothetical protein